MQFKQMFAFFFLLNLKWPKSKNFYVTLKRYRCWCFYILYIECPYITVMLLRWMLCAICQQANIFIINWRCPIKLKDEGAKMISQNRKWYHYVPRLLAKATAYPWIQNGVCWSDNLAPRYLYRKFFHGIKYNDYQSTATMKHQSNSVRFFRVLCSQNGRIQKNLWRADLSWLGSK